MEEAEAVCDEEADGKGAASCKERRIRKRMEENEEKGEGENEKKKEVDEEEKVTNVKEGWKEKRRREEDGRSEEK